MCSGASGVVYSISGVSNETSYSWSVPSGASVTAGTGTSILTVSWGSASGTMYHVLLITTVVQQLLL